MSIYLNLSLSIYLRLCPLLSHSTIPLLFPSMRLFTYFLYASSTPPSLPLPLLPPLSPFLPPVHNPFLGIILFFVPLSRSPSPFPFLSLSLSLSSQTPFQVPAFLIADQQYHNFSPVAFGGGAGGFGIQEESLDFDDGVQARPPPPSAAFAPARPGDSGPDLAKETVAEVDSDTPRTEFPETWLWDLVTVP